MEIEQMESILNERINTFENNLDHQMLKLYYSSIIRNKYIDLGSIKRYCPRAKIAAVNNGSRYILSAY